MMIVLKIAVMLAALYAIVSLLYIGHKASLLGKPIFYAPDKGSRFKGILYAFGAGMMPWEKESAEKHLLSYIAGVIYHIGIFTALIYLMLALISVPVHGKINIIFRILLLLGGVSGVGLLAKRIISVQMRVISYADDYAANLIVDLFIFMTLWHSFSMVVEPVLYIISLIMFLYIPVGKIRHCYFFFLTRILFGIYYGRRGVYPAPKRF